MTATTTQTDTNNVTKPNAALVKAPAPPPDQGGAIDVFASSGNFENAQRMAKALASSSLVPSDYRNNIPNVLIAMELSARIGASVFAVMQNLDIIHGKPSFRSTFLIATVNSCGRFAPLRFRWEGKTGTDSWGCRAVAKDRETGEECIGSLITIGIAKAEGWYGRNGSKWKTMPEQMLSYRAAAFWARLYAPELSLGMQTGDEVEDVYGGRGAIDVPSSPLPASSPKDLEAALLDQTPAHDPQTGEVSPSESTLAAEEREPGSDDV